MEGLAEGTEFGHSSAQIGYVVPKLFLWQWNKIFNQMGIFSITDVTSKSLFPGFITKNQIFS